MDEWLITVERTSPDGDVKRYNEVIEMDPMEWLKNRMDEYLELQNKGGKPWDYVLLFALPCDVGSDYSRKLAEVHET